MERQAEVTDIEWRGQRMLQFVPMDQ